MSSNKNISKMSNNIYTRFSLLSVEENSDGEEPSFIIKNNNDNNNDSNSNHDNDNDSNSNSNHDNKYDDSKNVNTGITEILNSSTYDKSSWTTVKKTGKKVVKKVFKNLEDKDKGKDKVKEKKFRVKKVVEESSESENENDYKNDYKNENENENDIINSNEDAVEVDLQLDAEYKFQNKWYIWLHEVDSKDWSTKSYKLVYVIENINDFWQFFNNINKLNQWKFNFFIMKSSSHPTWEHTTNRNGGTCSIRIDISQSVDIIEQLAILLVNESLTEEINDINGISFAAKGNWCVIKIWNRDNKNNISNQMPSYLRKIYPSISIKYKENIPEY